MKIAVASGKGGTGKTFFATNLFRVMQEAGLRTALVDCDAEVPNDTVFLSGQLCATEAVQVLCPEIDTEVCTRCGRCAEVCHFHAITCIPAVGYVRLQPDLCHACGACLHECPEGAIRPAYKTVGQVSSYATVPDRSASLFEARLAEGEHSPVPVIRQALSTASRSVADYLIFDAPPGCSCPFVHTVKDADRVILVTEPTPFGLSDLRHTVQVLRRLHKPFFVVINRAGLGSSELKEWLSVEHIPLLAEIPFSAEVAQSYADGTLACDVLPAFRQMFHGLVPSILMP